MANYKFKVSKDKKGEWRWNLVATNGQNIATGGEGFTTKAAVLKSIDSVQEHAKTAEVAVEE